MLVVFIYNSNLNSYNFIKIKQISNYSRILKQIIYKQFKLIAKYGGSGPTVGRKPVELYTGVRLSPIAFIFLK